MDVQKVKAALDIGLSAVMAAGYTRYQDNDAEAILEALAELDNQADEAWGVARQIYDGIASDMSILSDTHVFNPFNTACLIQQYAESFAAKDHARECAKCRELGGRA